MSRGSSWYGSFEVPTGELIRQLGIGTAALVWLFVSCNSPAQGADFKANSQADSSDFVTPPDPRFPTLAFHMDFRREDVSVQQPAGKPYKEIRNHEGRLFGWVLESDSLQGRPRLANVTLTPAGLQVKARLAEGTGSYICSGMHRTISGLTAGQCAFDIRPPFYFEVCLNDPATWGRDGHALWFFTQYHTDPGETLSDQLELDLFEIGAKADWRNDYGGDVSKIDITSNFHI